MRRYEALVIVDGALEEGDAEKAVKKFTDAIGTVGGTAGDVDRWGKRRFAYEIAHKYDGYYFVANFDAPEEAIARLENLIKISDEYIRGKIVRPEAV
jgi:small subunit ribosomal protein S6